MSKLILACPRGNISKAFAKWMAANHPEIEIISPTPFPFQLSALNNLTRDPEVRYFVNGCGLGNDKASGENSYAYVDTNVVGVLQQLEMVRRNGPDRIRYLNLGSIYEKSSSSVYAASKRMSRELIKSFRENHGLFAMQATLNFTEYYNRSPEYLSKRIVQAAVRIGHAIATDQPFEPLVIKRPDDLFRWTWAEDVAAGLWEMLNQEKPVERELITDELRSLREFVELAFREAGLDALSWMQIYDPNQREAFVQHFEVGMGHGCYRELVKVAPFEVQKMDIQWREPAALDWHPRFTLKDIVRELVQHELKQP